CQRTEDGLPAAVSAHHQPDDQTALVWKPLRPNGHGRGVPESIADADDHAEEDVERHKRGGEAGQQEPGADQDAAEEGADLWPLEILQATRGYKGERETDDGDRVHPRRVRTLPAEFLFERQ